LKNVENDPVNQLSLSIMTTSATPSIIITALLIALTAAAAETPPTDYRIAFDGILDNREYGARPDYPLNDETIFFARGKAEIGFAVNAENKIRAGIMPTIRFGAPDTARIPVKALMYFQHESRRVRFRFGAFPRQNSGIYGSSPQRGAAEAPAGDGALDRLPPWFFGDESACRRPYVHGAAVDAGGFWGLTAGTWVDWTGLRDTSVNEAFLFGYGLAYSRGAFFARHDFMMYHLARPLNPTTNEYVKDNGGASAEAGAAWGKIMKYADTLTASAGVILSLDRDRADMLWHTPAGGFVSGYAGYRMLALRGFYYAGQPQRMAWGGNFYNYSGIESFGRGDVILRFFNKNRDKRPASSGTDLSAELTASFYFFGGKTGTSQHFVLRTEVGR
jgi:hypothetical protein